MLTLAIPALNLCLLGLCSVLLPLCLPIDFRSPAVAGSWALLAGTLLGWALYLFRYKINPDLWPWGILLVIPGGVGGALAGACFAGRIGNPLQWLALIAWLVSVAGPNRQIPGARENTQWLRLRANRSRDCKPANAPTVAQLTAERKAET